MSEGGKISDNAQGCEIREGAISAFMTVNQTSKWMIFSTDRSLLVGKGCVLIKR